MPKLNPFVPAENVAKPVKLLLFGEGGTGKTIAALSFGWVGKLAMVDTERGTDLYVGKTGINDFDIMRLKTMRELKPVLEFLRDDAGKTYKALVIDPITNIYDSSVRYWTELIEHSNKRDNAYTKANAEMRDLYALLTDLPIHVIVTAHERSEYASKNGYFEKIGVKPGADQGIEYPFDFAIQMFEDHSGVVTKTRSDDLPMGKKLPKVSWSVFEKISLKAEQGRKISTGTEGDALRGDSTRSLSADEWREWCSKWMVDAGLSVPDLRMILHIQSFTANWKGTLADADAMVAAFVEERDGRVEVPNEQEAR